MQMVDTKKDRTRYLDNYNQLMFFKMKVVSNPTQIRSDPASAVCSLSKGILSSMDHKVGVSNKSKVNSF